jgi:pSer/pThr/pTyr-binding forkhead associated (FHA) protein
VASLVLVSPADLEIGRRHVLPPQGVVVGRGTGCSIQIPLSDVSRCHARIYRTVDAWFVEDLSSTNGCYVNDFPVDTCVLRDADLIQIGGVIFKFQIAADVGPPPRGGTTDNGGSSGSPASPATAAHLERSRN